MRLLPTSRWALLLTLLAAACSDSPEPGAGGEASPDSSESPRAVVDVGGGSTTTPLVTTVPSRFEFVDYQTSPGGGNPVKALKVWPDGRAACSRGTAWEDFSVAAGEVTELRRALEAADMASLPPNNGTPTPDGAGGRVIFGGQSVRFFGGAVPPPLAPAVATLDRLLARGCP